MREKITLHLLKNVKIIFLAALLTKLYVLMIDLATTLLFTDKKFSQKI